ncbi:MAG: maleylpyruvate isomerase N-terminal domain-containing protein [Acidimicrobiales bacterium]
MSVQETYLSAAKAFADLVERVPEQAWDRRCLGVWSLREVTAHASTAALSSVLKALAQQATAETITSPDGYYALAKTVDPEVYRAAVQASTDGARSDATALGDQPARAVRRLVEQVNATLATISDDPVVESAAGGMRLSAWLPTRTFELAVHSLDIATSAEIPANLPEAVLADATALAARIAAASGDATTVLRALTGRAPLPDCFSVV